ncbi:HAD family hydrolase [Chitinispirillales bacterium ANBcel5]|uniref:HAD family hydrolase n=1 Tax=Cellulosispirillum alkaliphilum TaxID=3039283 RepID=UPI002A546778|nr:HAD family hydrolase [Chitinispirillales bacterium ANBcel5]
MNNQRSVTPGGILFDLDDTIVAFGLVSGPVLQEVCSAYAGETGVECQKLLDSLMDASRWYWGDKERHRIGRNNQKQARRKIVEEAFKSLNITDSELGERLADEYSAKRLSAMYLFPGAIDTLKHFKSKGVKMALVTNGEAGLQRDKIKRFGLESYFDTILIEGELGFGKPLEGIYNLALERLGEEASNCWMVGDNLEWEVEVPSRLGFYTVWNDVRGKGLPAGSTIAPHRIVRSIAELM